MTRIILNILTSFVLVFASIASGDAETPQPLRILMLGDSLTEGYGVALSQAYPALLQESLRRRHPEWGDRLEVINAGIGGSTSASATRRLNWHLRGNPSLVVLALGSNDMLRGVPAKSTEKNLREAILVAKSRRIPVILAGTRVPPNYGAAYRREFEAVFPRLAREFSIPLIPFLLEGVAGVRELNLEDGIHPNETGQKKIAATVEPWIEKALREMK